MRLTGRSARRLSRQLRLGATSSRARTFFHPAKEVRDNSQRSPSGFIPLDDPELAWPSEQRFKHFERVVPVSVVLVRKRHLAVWQLITLQQERDCVSASSSLM